MNRKNRKRLKKTKQKYTITKTKISQKHKKMVCKQDSIKIAKKVHRQMYRRRSWTTAKKSNKTNQNTDKKESKYVNLS